MGGASEKLKTYLKSYNIQDFKYRFDFPVENFDKKISENFPVLVEP